MRWRRSDLKRNAKLALGKSFWTAFGALFVPILLLLAIDRMTNGAVAAFFGVGNAGVFSELAKISARSAEVNNPLEMLGIMRDILLRLLPSLVILSVISSVVSFLMNLFIRPHLEIGSCRWFSRNREMPIAAPLGTIFGVFKSGHYFAVIGARIFKAIWIWIWSLPVFISSLIPVVMIIVFFIQNGLLSGLRVTNPLTWMSTALLIAKQLSAEPFWIVGFYGIIFLCNFFGLVWSFVVLARSYAYYMSDWILADNPGIGARRSLELSKLFMQGHRFRVFKLNLSFIGWYLLSLMTLVLAPLAILAVEAYRYSTLAEFYAMRRDELTANGEITMEELGYRMRQSQNAESQSVEEAVEETVGEVVEDQATELEAVPPQGESSDKQNSD